MGKSTNNISQPVVEACAGALGGCIATIATYPLMAVGRPFIFFGIVALVKFN